MGRLSVSQKDTLLQNIDKAISGENYHQILIQLKRYVNGFDHELPQQLSFVATGMPTDPQKAIDYCAQIDAWVEYKVATFHAESDRVKFYNEYLKGSPSAPPSSEATGIAVSNPESAIENISRWWAGLKEQDRDKLEEVYNSFKKSPELFALFKKNIDKILDHSNIVARSASDEDKKIAFCFYVHANKAFFNQIERQNLAVIGSKAKIVARILSDGLLYCIAALLFGAKGSLALALGFPPFLLITLLCGMLLVPFTALYSTIYVIEKVISSIVDFITREKPARGAFRLAITGAAAFGGYCLGLLLVGSLAALSGPWGIVAIVCTVAICAAIGALASKQLSRKISSSINSNTNDPSSTNPGKYKLSADERKNYEKYGLTPDEADKALKELHEEKQLIKKALITTKEGLQALKVKEGEEPLLDDDSRHNNMIDKIAKMSLAERDTRHVEINGMVQAIHEGDLAIVEAMGKRFYVGGEIPQVPPKPSAPAVTATPLSPDDQTATSVPAPLGPSYEPVPGTGLGDTSTTNPTVTDGLAENDSTHTQQFGQAAQ